MDEVKKAIGPWYNPLRWILRRFLSTEKTDEAMLFVGAIMAGEVD